jgi:atypical dual specificity phosphatase
MRLGDVGRSLRGVFTDRPYNFSWFLDNIAASGRPVTRGQVEWLSKNGVNAIVSLTEERIPAKFLEGLMIDYIHYPLIDHGEPTVEQLVELVELIDGLLNSGKSVLIHCAAGLGRTGTVLASYLVVKKGYSAAEAIEEVRRKRPGSIEPCQENAVKALEEHAKMRGAAD